MALRGLGAADLAYTGPPMALPTDLQADLASLAQLIQHALAARPSRSRLATPDEIQKTLAAVSAGGTPALGSTAAPPTVLQSLARAFGLSPAEAELLLVAVAPEVDPRFRRIYGFLLDNLNRERPTLALATELLGRRGCDAEALRALLQADAPLRRLLLLSVGGAGTDSWWGRELVTSERIARAVLGQTQLDDALVGLALLASPGVAVSTLQLPIGLVERVCTLVTKAGAKEAAGVGASARPLVVLKGPAGAGKQHTARAIATLLARPMLVVDGSALPKDQNELARLCRLCVREALLVGAVLYIDHADTQTDPEGPAHPLPGMMNALRNFPDLVFLAGQRRVEGLGPLGRDVLRLQCDLPSPGERARLWAAALPQDLPLAPDLDLVEVARKYGVGAGQILAGAQEAAAVTRLRGEGAELRTSDLLDGARGQLLHRLSSVAERVTRTYKWEDLILPADVVEVLKEMVNFAKHRQYVYEELGFGGKHAYGRGLAALFSGPPGTGKTMVAGIMARELDMELFRIDLSRVVSKWIGETEKNLGRVFDEAALSHAIILFDEADSLFANRTDVKSSVDRYANLEVNYLLQRMEAYEGVSILTSNFSDTLDDAFKRRLNFRIEFPFPEEEDRERLWPIMLPREMKRADDIDWPHLARRFKLSGGNIRNAVLRAAFYSVDAHAPIDQEMLETAAIRESEEMGKLVQRLPTQR